MRLLCIYIYVLVWDISVKQACLDSFRLHPHTELWVLPDASLDDVRYVLQGRGELLHSICMHIVLLRFLVLVMCGNFYL